MTEIFRRLLIEIGLADAICITKQGSKVYLDIKNFMVKGIIILAKL